MSDFFFDPDATKIFRPLRNTLFMRRELIDLLHIFSSQDDVRIVVRGRSGEGKSTLAHILADHSADLSRFAGGVLRIAGTMEHDYSQLASMPLTSDPSERSLLVIDDFDQMDLDDQTQWLRSISETSRLSVLLIVNSTSPIPPGYGTIELGSLDRATFAVWWEQLTAHDDELRLSSKDVDLLYRISGGNPRFALSGFAAARLRKGQTIGDILPLLTPFEAQGLVDLSGRPLSSGSEREVIVDVTRANSAILDLLKQKPELSRELPPRKFEEIVADLLRDMGYDVSLTPESKDGGFDIYAARKDGLGRFLFLVECKRFVPPTKVEVSIVRSLHGVVNTHRATAGAIVTTSFFTSGARELQKRLENQMHLHDYVTLQQWIRDFPLKRG